ncbi:hypothetical protein PEB0150_008970 [Bartonella apis]|nr:hypothetical protein PEB0150_008970 [Bartonella apis]
MTLVAAVVAWRSVMKQIRSNEKLAKEEVDREAKQAEEARDNALRAVKPRLLRCLVELMDIAKRNINLHFICETKPSVIKNGKQLDFSDIPESNVEIIAKAIELSRGTVSKRLTDIIQSFQVVMAREREGDKAVWVKLPRNDYAQSTTSESNKPQMNHNYEMMYERVIEWSVVYAIAQSALAFARGTKGDIPATVDKDTIENSLIILHEFHILSDDFKEVLNNFFSYGSFEGWYRSYSQ